MDAFAYVARLDPQHKKVTLLSPVELKSALSQRWLRASYRKLDVQRSTEWRPFHPHDEAQPLTSDGIYALDMEIWPMSVSLQAG
jgi:hypothetical protein